MTVMSRTYRAPPITEAVLELQFGHAITMDVVNKISSRLGKNYVFKDPDEALNFSVNAVTGISKTDNLWQGFRHSSLDRADLSIIRTVAFAASRLAPYTNWEEFRARVERDWEIVSKSDAVGELARVGLRYINRIDVPDSPDVVNGINDYLTIFPVMPESNFGNINTYLMQISRPYGPDGLVVVINSALGVSPLLGHSALVLDIDVSLSGKISCRRDELWRLLSSMRDCKNDVFEECITDLTRELIG